jgi:hypothetical protein
MRMRSTVVRNALLAGSAIAAAITVSQHAEARSVMAGAAAAANYDIDCLSVYHGSLTNTCPVLKGVVFPLFVDNGGAKTVRVTGFSNSGPATVKCWAEGRYKSSAFHSTSPTVSLPSFGSYVDMALTGASVPSGGQLTVTCTLDPGTTISVVNWNP